MLVDPRDSSSELLPQPNWRRELDAFLSRPVSLVAALIFAVTVCVVSFMLLTFPAIASFYYAVRHSRREDYFIDLPNVSRTASLVLVGMWEVFSRKLFGGLLRLASDLHTARPALEQPVQQVSE
jgi:hypothetical protein